MKDRIVRIIRPKETQVKVWARQQRRASDKCQASKQQQVIRESANQCNNTDDTDRQTE